MTKFENKQRNAEIFAEKNYYDNKAHNLEVEVLNLLRERARDTVMIDKIQIQLLDEQHNHNVTRNAREVLVNKAANQLVRINKLTDEVENIQKRNEERYATIEEQAKKIEEQAEKIEEQADTIIDQEKDIEDRWKQFQELHKERDYLNLEVKELKEKLSIANLMTASLEAELDKLRGDIH